MARQVDLAGAAHLVLADGVRFLEPEKAVFEAMLAGWQRQQQARFLRPATIGPRLALVRRFADFTGQYPWQWTPQELEAFSSSLASSSPPLAQSTVRSYQVGLRLFCEFATDPRYGWAQECLDRFGEATSQICHEWNTVEHRSEYEGQPARRALTYDEVQRLFDAADGRVEQARRLGRKGALSAVRDAVALKTVYAFGLRRGEAVGLDVVDFRRNPRVPRYGRFGSVQVRYGKAARGGPPKRRTVLTVPEMDWIVDLMDEWCTQGRQAWSPGDHPAMFLTERGGRFWHKGLDSAFARSADAAGLPEELTLHCLRHSYVTHLLEFGYPALMVQQQVGHSHASTTAIYTTVSDEYRNRLMEAALAGHEQLAKAPAPGGTGRRYGWVGRDSGTHDGDPVAPAPEDGREGPVPDLRPGPAPGRTRGAPVA